MHLASHREFQNNECMMTKSLKSINKCILIVSDSADELNDLQHLLAVDFGSCLKADSELEGLQLFNENHPTVLILAFQEIEKAEHFYLSLYRHDSQIYSVPHQTLLLCKNNESSKAYQLCKSGTFDDRINMVAVFQGFVESFEYDHAHAASADGAARFVVKSAAVSVFG